MISGSDLYTVLSAMAPLYAAMMAAYASVRWWNIFTPVQCSGINRFVAVFAVPLLSFHFIATNNPYRMDTFLILADSIAKILILVLLAAWASLSPSGNLDWLITLFAVATLPNTLVMGIPLLSAMYGPHYGDVMVQLVVLQCIVWYTLLLFLFEYRAARLLVLDHFPAGAAADIVSFAVDPDVISLDGAAAPLEALADFGDDGKVRVTIRRSTSHSSSRRPNHMDYLLSPRRSSSKAITPRPSNMTGVEIYSVYSSRNNTPSYRDYVYPTSSTTIFSASDYWLQQQHSHHHPPRSYTNNYTPNNLPLSSASPRRSYAAASDVPSSRGPTPRHSNFNGEGADSGVAESGNVTNPFSRSDAQGTSGRISHPKAAPRGTGGGNQTSKYLNNSAAAPADTPYLNVNEPMVYSPRLDDDGKELHMFVWSSTASPVSPAAMAPAEGAEKLHIHASAVAAATSATSVSSTGGKSSYNYGLHQLRELKQVQLPADCGVNATAPAAPTDHHHPNYINVDLAGGTDMMRESWSNNAGRRVEEGEGFRFGSTGGGEAAATGEKERTISIIGGVPPPPIATTTTANSSTTAGSRRKMVADETTPPPSSGGRKAGAEMPPASVMVRLILRMVARKLLHNPNTYSSVLGLAWSLIAFRWNIGMPKIIVNSISILSDAGLGMAMFSLGLFMALQPRLIACGVPLATFAMAIRFLTGPAVMAACSIAVGLRGVHLHAAIVQAALPQGIVPFVFAREYDLHPDILSTAVIFGMLVALPTTLLYYVLLGI